MCGKRVLVSLPLHTYSELNTFARRSRFSLLKFNIIKAHVSKRNRSTNRFYHIKSYGNIQFRSTHEHSVCCCFCSVLSFQALFCFTALGTFLMRKLTEREIHLRTVAGARWSKNNSNIPTFAIFRCFSLICNGFSHFMYIHNFFRVFPCA